MTHVVLPACTKCQACLNACPVNAFHESEHILVINPEVCIDCGACTAECPPQAIVYEDDLPEDAQASLIFNARQAKHCPLIDAAM
ncbi:MAG: 4Fe-4S dicluster domain-containing protein [Candidatus Omnitrophica bacterium]|nr:4Fe-4S dicluster domain-containing protein [Candidatus Omnitrophota bacterium]